MAELDDMPPFGSPKQLDRPVAVLANGAGRFQRKEVGASNKRLRLVRRTLQEPLKAL